MIVLLPLRCSLHGHFTVSFRCSRRRVRTVPLPEIRPAFRPAHENRREESQVPNSSKPLGECPVVIRRVRQRAHREPSPSSHRRDVYADAAGAVDRAAGYELLPPTPSSKLAAALDTCRLLFETKVNTASSPDEPKRAEKRAFLRNLMDNDDLRDHPQLVEFALSDWALGIVTNYLQVVPYLNRVDLLYSVPRPTEDRIASQLFHVDPEGVTQVKFFFNVFDTDDNDGPFAFIPADDSARILREIRTLRRKRGEPHVGRYSDDEIAAVGGTDAIIQVTGPRGSGVAVDTSRCLHFGSRVRPGSFRLCMYLQYCASLEQGNVFDIERYRDDPIRYMAVKHSANGPALTSRRRTKDVTGERSDVIHAGVLRVAMVRARSPGSCEPTLPCGLSAGDCQHSSRLVSSASSKASPA